jgi:hypothetical protein
VSKFDRFISAATAPAKGKARKAAPITPAPTSDDTPRRGTLAKRNDPEYRQALAYVRAATMKSVKSRLAEEEREFSDLVEELLSKWLNS